MAAACGGCVWLSCSKECLLALIEEGTFGSGIDACSTCRTGLGVMVLGRFFLFGCCFFGVLLFSRREPGFLLGIKEGAVGSGWSAGTAGWTGFGLFLFA